MADELKDAMDQMKTHAAAIDGVQSAMLGQPLTALPDATHNKCVAAIYLRSGVQDNTYSFGCPISRHMPEVRFFWKLQPTNQEVVEQALASMVDLVLAKYNSDINLTDNATVALLTGEEGEIAYTTGYELINDVLHRILSFPMIIVQKVHEFTA